MKCFDKLLDGLRHGSRHAGSMDRLRSSGPFIAALLFDDEHYCVVRAQKNTEANTPERIGLAPTVRLSVRDAAEYGIRTDLPQGFEPFYPILRDDRHDGTRIAIRGNDGFPPSLSVTSLYLLRIGRRELMEAVALLPTMEQAPFMLLSWDAVHEAVRHGHADHALSRLVQQVRTYCFH